MLALLIIVIVEINQGVDFFQTVDKCVAVDIHRLGGNRRISFADQIHVQNIGQIGVILPVITEECLKLGMTERADGFLLSKYVYDMSQIIVPVNIKRGTVIFAAQFNRPESLLIVFGKVKDIMKIIPYTCKHTIFSA